MLVIASFRHKGLKRLWEKDDPKLINAAMRDRVTNILAVLEVASEPGDMDLPGYDLHRLIGNLKEFWSVKVTGKWRVIFRFEDANARDIDLTDYH